MILPGHRLATTLHVCFSLHCFTWCNFFPHTSSCTASPHCSFCFSWCCKVVATVPVLEPEMAMDTHWALMGHSLNTPPIPRCCIIVSHTPHLFPPMGPRWDHAFHKPYPARVHQQNSNAAVLPDSDHTQQHCYFAHGASRGTHSYFVRKVEKTLQNTFGFIGHIPRGSISKIAMLLCRLTAITHSSIAILLMDPRGEHIVIRVYPATSRVYLCDDAIAILAPGRDQIQG